MALNPPLSGPASAEPCILAIPTQGLKALSVALSPDLILPFHPLPDEEPE